MQNKYLSEYPSISREVFNDIKNFTDIKNKITSEFNFFS